MSDSYLANEEHSHSICESNANKTKNELTEFRSESTYAHTLAHSLTHIYADDERTNGRNEEKKLYI